MQLEIKMAETRKLKPINLKSFGTLFTDHMFVMDFSSDKGWHKPRIEPFSKKQFSPAASVLHYGQGVFEGLKAYRNKEGKIHLFRAEENIKRLNRSATKLCIPSVDEELILNCIEKLINLDKDWVPSERGTSLYIRPFIIATEEVVSVRPANKYSLYIILSPVGNYFKEGFQPVNIIVENNFVRTVEGGLGEAKTMANYAASMLATQQANKKGFAQVLWLDGKERKYIEEVGTMNIFFKIKDEIITPPLTGTILPGITRDTVIKVLKSWGVPVSEYRITIDELMEVAQLGYVEEIFGTGTAAVISPIGKLLYKDKEININNYGEDSIANKLFNYITNLQHGLEKDNFNWVKVLNCRI